MKNIFRKLDVTSTRLETGLKKSHDLFYHKCVKHKRDDLIRKVDTFINGHKSEADQRRGKVNQRNSATANYLTPFSTSNQGNKKKKAIIQDSNSSSYHSLKLDAN